jgi:hypothetical protein
VSAQTPSGDGEELTGSFGAVGAPDVPDHISLWGLRLAICQPYMYANVRRTKVIPGTESPLKNCKPGQLDWVIIRENSEGEYAGHGGRSHRGLEHEIGTEVTIFTRTGIKRIARYAFQVAQSRPRKLLTYVTKSNAMRNGMVLWDEAINEVAKEFPDVVSDCTDCLRTIWSKLTHLDHGPHARRRHDCADDAQARIPRHYPRDQLARGYPLRPRGRSRRLDRYRPDMQH